MEGKSSEGLACVRLSDGMDASKTISWLNRMPLIWERGWRPEKSVHWSLHITVVGHGRS